LGGPLVTSRTTFLHEGHMTVALSLQWSVASAVRATVFSVAVWHWLQT